MELRHESSVVAAQAGLALVRVSEPNAGRRSPPDAPPADHLHSPIPTDMPFCWNGENVQIRTPGPTAGCLREGGEILRQG